MKRKDSEDFLGVEFEGTEIEILISEEESESYRETALLDKIADFSITNKDSIDYVKKYTDCLNELDQCYKDNYRHRYSVISKYVYSKNQAEQETSQYAAAGCEELMNDISADKLLSEEEKEMYVSKLVKIKDHIDLELFHENVQEKTAALLETKIREESKKMQEVSQKSAVQQREMKDAAEQLVSTQKKLDNTEMGYISTLGIFAGIVMAFSGLFSLTTNLFESLSKAPLSRTIFVFLVVAFAFMNLLFCMFYCIGKLLKRPVTSKCYISGEQCCADCEKENKCNGARRLLHKNRATIIVNIILLAAIFVSAMFVLFNEPIHRFIGVL